MIQSHSQVETTITFFFSAKKSFIGQNKSIWGPLELVEKLCPESISIAISARDLPGIKYAPVNLQWKVFLTTVVIIGVLNLSFYSLFRTGVGRARAWLHLALMQKKVADYMKVLLDRKDLLRLVTMTSYVDLTWHVFYTRMLTCLCA